MNDKDKEAFEKWWQNMYDSYVEFRDWQGCDITFDKKEDMQIGWQAACEYKNKEYSDIADARMQTSLNNVKLEAENAKLRECVEFYAEPWERVELDGKLLVRKLESYDPFIEVHHKAMQCLKELDEEL